MATISIEEKAKAYDEAIERAKNFIENGDEGEKTIAESIFAGLMEENEDERIRKALLSFVRGLLACHDKPNAERDEKYESWIAWLEKQGEQKPAEEYNITGIGSKHATGKLKEILDKKEKPAWSEEDERCFENAIMYCEWARDKAPDVPCYETSEKSINWLKSLKGRVGNFDDGYKVGFSAAKHNQWKPSDEQMEALDFAVGCIVPAEFCVKRKVLKELLEQLKIQKGEKV